MSSSATADGWSLIPLFSVQKLVSEGQMYSALTLLITLTFRMHEMYAFHLNSRESDIRRDCLALRQQVSLEKYILKDLWGEGL